MSRTESSASSESSELRVLVVDDSPTARKIMRRIMASLDFVVDEAGCGREALEAIAGNGYHVVLLDWNMPDIAGVELVRGLRAREAAKSSARHLPILMVTQNVEKEHIAEALDAGVDEYLMKPFTASALYEKLSIMNIVDPARHPPPEST